MSVGRALVCLAALLVSGCAYRVSTVLTNPETIQATRCDRIEGTPVGAVSIALQAALNSQYDRCIANAKKAGFFMPPTTGADFQLDRAMYVTAVRGDARRAGLRVGDKVLEIDGFDLSLPAGRRDYFEQLDSKRPGDRVRLLIERDGSPVELSVTLPAAGTP